MNNVIDITKFIEKKRIKEEVANIIDSLQEMEYKDYSKVPIDQLIAHIHAIENRHLFDLKFLALLDKFMEMHYPEYSWRFDIFLDKFTS